MERTLPRVAITQGDVNGVGYELIFKALQDSAMLELLTPVIYGAPKAAAQHAARLAEAPAYTIIRTADEIKDGRINLMATTDEELSLTPGHPTEQSGEAGLQAIDRALEDYRAGAVDALVTAPLESSDAFSFSGQSRYVEDHLETTGDENAFTLLAHGDLRLALATRNLPLSQVSESLTTVGLQHTAEALLQTLCRDFRLSNPRIALLALNPKAGEGGQLGTEEQEIIRPAIQALSDKGLQVFGPYATDAFFAEGLWQQFDATVAMYYDQALTPFRALTQGEGCLLTAGLPLVHTAPLPASALTSGTEADAASMRAAIYLAIDAWRHRQQHDEPMANPLKKLYKERREDGDRNRFKRSEKPAGK